MRYASRVGCIALLLFLPGCAQELTAGGQRGEVDAVVVDDGAPAGAALSMNRMAERSASHTSAQLLGAVQGTIEVDATVTIVDAGGRGHDLARVAPRVEVRIASTDSAALARDLVYVGIYDRALITFTRVEANITGGLELVGGLQLTGRIQVPLDVPLTVEATIPLLVRSNRPQRIVIDLNAADWLVEASAAGVVPAASFASRVRVRVR